MNKKRKIIILVGVILIVSFIFFQIRSNIYTSSFNEVNKKELEVSLNELISKYVNKKNFSGSVLVAEDDKIIFNEGYSYAKRYLGIKKNEAETKYLIASISKTFTALAIMKLHEKGLLNLDDNITKFLPEYEKWNNITIHHLLNHTSGIPNYYGSPLSYIKYYISNIKPEKILSQYKDVPLLFSPGEQFSYSNTNYILLGKIIEKVSNETYINYLKDSILKPLELDNTGYEANTKSVKNLAKGYTLNNIMEITLFNLSNLYSAGGLYSTTEDLFKFIYNLDQDKLFNEFTMIKKSNGYYGYGISVNEMEDGSLVYYHTGGGPGISTGMYKIPDKNIIIVILSNNQQFSTKEMVDDIYKSFSRSIK